MRVFSVAWMVLSIVVLGGCAELTAIGREYGRQTALDFRRMFGIAEPGLTRIQRYNLAFEKEDFTGALTAVREEIAAPEKNSTDHLIGVRLLGMRAMEKYATQVGLTAGMDGEVMRWYQGALDLAKDREEQQAKLYNYIQTFYGNTNRPGMAIPYAHRVLAIWERHRNPYQTFVAHMNLWSLYSTMGKLPTAAKHREAAADLGRRIFNVNSFRDPKGGDGDGYDWLTYSDFLEKQFTDLEPGPRSVDEAFRIFSRYERVMLRKIRPSYLAYLTFADTLIRLGETKMGLYYFKRGERAMMGELADRKATETGFICGSISILLRLHKLEDAQQGIDRCRTLDPAQARGGAFRRLAGQVYEASGDLDRAIQEHRASVDRCEQARRTFAIDERVTFFNNACRLSSFRLIHSLSRRFLITQSRADFVAALDATERLRARQFGEVLESRQGQLLPVPPLDALQQVLGSRELLLDYILTDAEIIVFAVTRHRFTVVVKPYDAKRSAQAIQQLAKDLATPGRLLESRVAQDRLGEISAQVLAPVQDWLTNATSLAVLPDGALYLVPFGVFSLGGAPARSLVESQSVRVTPSLRYLVWARRQAPGPGRQGLLAIADPMYTTQPEIPGFAFAEASATRSSALLRYFSPLPETRTEVSAIAALFGGDPVRVLLGKEARESALKQIDLRSYRFVHIATHGVVGDGLPGIREPALLLSAEEGEDGLLTVSEAEQLRLQAELTVLSACSTGAGALNTGEGVMGLSRAFLMAGSRSVLVSLWPVNSMTTAELMVDFYRRLRAGTDAAEALRQTMVSMLHPVVTDEPPPAGFASTQRHDPYYWAPFILIGP